MTSRLLTACAAVLLLLPTAASAQSGTIRYERSVTRDMARAAEMLRPGADRPAPADGAARDGAPRDGARAGGRAGGRAGAGPAAGLPAIQQYATLTLTFDGMIGLTSIEEAELELPNRAGPGGNQPMVRLRRPGGGAGGADVDGAMITRIAQAMPRREDRAVYVDQAAGTFVRSVEFLTRDFRIEGDVPGFQWRLLGEPSEFLGYAVQKAEADWDGRTVEAWFTVDIPGFAAPDVFTGLPGVVLMVSVDRGATLIQAVEVDLDTPVDAIEPPTDGETMTAEEFEALVQERTEEFRQQMQGRLRRAGGGGA